LQRIHAIALRPALCHLIGGVAQMHCRLAVDPLRLKTPVIDTRLVPVPLQMPVDQMRPLLPPCDELLVRIQAPVFLCREPVLAKRPHRHHDVRVVVPLVAVCIRRMDRDIGHIALTHERLAGKIFHQPFALLVGEFMRQGDFKLAGELRVFPLLRTFRFVPEPVAVMRPFRRILRSHDVGEQNPLGPRRVVGFSESSFF
jgi:hypothetical protein